MKITAANRHIWERLFQAAIEFRDLAPWQWMYDSDMFGVEDPASGETGWCCIMGAAGQVFALGVYQGLEGFHSYLRLVDAHEQDLEETDFTAVGLEQKILKVEFVDRDEIDRVDREAFKKLGLKFRGSRQWVQIRDMQPGYLPWHLTDEQAIFLTHCLHQAMEVAVRFRDNEDLLEDEEGNILIRTCENSKSGLQWSDQYVPEPEWEDPPLRKVDPFLLNRAKKELERKEMALCFSLDYLPGAFHAEGDETRPFFTKIGIWIAYGSGFILGTELFSPKQFDVRFDQVFFQKMHEMGMIPMQLIVNSQMAHLVLEPIADALEIELIYHPDLEIFEEVRSGFDQFFKGF